MSLILSLETSTSVCSVALHRSGELIAAREIHIPQSHASRLAPMIDEVRREAGIELKDLQAVAIASGPGSYTGLRIGTSTAKALCYSLNLPLIAVGTLDVMAYAVSLTHHEGSFLCPMIDARRMEVYCQVVTNTLDVKQPVAAKIIDGESFAEFLEAGSILFFGDGAAKCKSTLNHERALFLDDVFPSAAVQGILAHKKFLAGQVEDLIYFEPFYLKEFLIKKPA